MTAILLVLAVVPIQAQEVVDGFSAGTHLGSFGRRIPYRLFIPEQRSGQALPLIVYLHGSGGGGTDNLRQISGGNAAGTHLWTTPAMQGRHPAFVLAPQVPVTSRWSDFESDALAPYADDALALIAKLSREFAIDTDRIYLIGQSLGGYGTWDIVSKRPELFAAAVPLCGAGDRSRVLDAGHVAIWAFHGARDAVVPVQGSRDMVAALKSIGSAVKYTEYPDVGHNVWTVAFAERELPEWLFAQKRHSH